MTLNPIHLRTFIEVAACGSFAAAARRLGYTASAVSQQIATLERDTGLQLFIRTSRLIHLTSEGAAFVPHVHRGIAELDRLADAGRALAGGRTGRLTIGSFPTAMTGLAAPALARFTRSCPEVEVILSEGEPGLLVRQVQTREVDVALAYEYGACPATWPEEVQVLSLLDEALLLLVSTEHPMAGRTGLDKLASEPWIAPREGTAGALALERTTAEAGFQPKVMFRTNDYAAIRSFVSIGLGVAIVPALAWQPTPGVAHQAVPGPRAFRRVFAVTRRIGSSPVHEPALEALHRAAERLRTRNPLLSMPTGGGGRVAAERNGSERLMTLK